MQYTFAPKVHRALGVKVVHLYTKGILGAKKRNDRCNHSPNAVQSTPLVSERLAKLVHPCSLRHLYCASHQPLRWVKRYGVHCAKTDAKKVHTFLLCTWWYAQQRCMVYIQSTCIETYALFMHQRCKQKQRFSYIEEYKRCCAVEPKAQKKV